LFDCGLNPTKPSHLSGSYQIKVSRLNSEPNRRTKEMRICFPDYPKTDNNFLGFATLLVNREVFGHLLLTRQAKDSIKNALIGK